MLRLLVVCRHIVLSCTLLLLGCTQQSIMQSASSTTSVVTSTTSLVQTAQQIDTSKWKRFASATLGLQFQYPPTYITRSDGHRIELINPDGQVEISFDRAITSIPAEVASHFGRQTSVRWANYGIEIRNPDTLAVAMDIQTASLDFAATYLFTKETNVPFPTGGPTTYPVIRANVLADGTPPADLQPGEKWLNLAQQILATVSVK